MLNNSANSDYKDIEENELDAEITQGLQISSLLNNSITSFEATHNKLKINEIGNVNVDELVDPNSQFNSSLNQYYQIMDSINTRSNTIKKEINSTKKYITAKYTPNTENYEKWDLNEILLWTKLLEHGRFEKYLSALSVAFRESEICGEDLPHLSTADLSVSPFNIASFKDKRDLISHFKRLQSKEINNSQEKKVRIYVDGCWDVMHSGHYNAFRQAKSLGDILVVGVHSDAEIARHKREPVMKNEQRMAAVQACKWADEVVFGVPYVVSRQLLDKLNCDYVAHGDDIAIAADGRSAYHTVMDKLKIFRRTPGVSTTHLIQRLLVAASNSNVEENGTAQSWSSFIASSSRISAFSNNRTPTKDDVVVYIDGVFDLFHIGHIAALKKAKELGTFLFVGLYNDQTVRQRKGTCFPLMGLQERVLNVLSCQYVDDVLIGCPWKITSQVTKSLNIKHVVITPNTKFAPDEMDRYDVPQKLGMLKEIKTESDFTTDVLMQNIVKRQQQLVAQNAKKVEKAKEYVNTQTYVQEKTK